MYFSGQFELNPLEKKKAIFRSNYFHLKKTKKHIFFKIFLNKLS